MTITATYSPEDNKIRLYSTTRLDTETYERVRAAGFIWAPKQSLFVAPMWTPARADLAQELAGEIGDEDTSLVDRAEERADRFDGYSYKRAADADRAHAAVASIADNIPFGQPILVGHHSERHARKDAQRIENGMRKAIKMWETSSYWTARAAGALHHAKYKELPAVRARRIKGLEADKRKCEREQQKARDCLATWEKVNKPGAFKKNGEPVTREEVARYIAGNTEAGHLTVVVLEGTRWCAYDVLRPADERGPHSKCPVMTVDDVLIAAREAYPARVAAEQRWIDHINNRLAYENAMLAESGYTPPPKKASKAAERPLLNYPGTIVVRDRWHDGKTLTFQAVGITKAELAAIPSEMKGTLVSADGTHRVRETFAMYVPQLRAAINAAGHDDTTRANRLHDSVVVYATDSKIHTRPGVEVVQAVAEKEEVAKEALLDAALASAVERSRRPVKAPDVRKEKAAALREALKNGVKVVVADQLFTTPKDVARRMVELADVSGGQRILEPSAGTGNLVTAIIDRCMGMDLVGKLVMVEVNPALAKGLEERRQRQLYATAENFEVHTKDFLTCNGDLGLFHRIVMNPPFKNADDVKHIAHAFHMLRPGGRLVAICANGPRQQAALKPIAKQWIDLPDGTFADEGTNVRTAMVVIERGL